MYIEALYKRPYIIYGPSSFENTRAKRHPQGTKEKHTTWLPNDYHILCLMIFPCITYLLWLFHSSYENLYSLGSTFSYENTGAKRHCQGTKEKHTTNMTSKRISNLSCNDFVIVCQRVVFHSALLSPSQNTKKTVSFGNTGAKRHPQGTKEQHTTWLRNGYHILCLMTSPCIKYSAAHKCLYTVSLLTSI